jgi:hypothetical protein
MAMTSWIEEIEIPLHTPNEDELELMIEIHFYIKLLQWRRAEV